VSGSCILGNVRKLFASKGAWTMFRGIPTHNRKDIEFHSFMNRKI